MVSRPRWVLTETVPEQDAYSLSEKPISIPAKCPVEQLTIGRLNKSPPKVRAQGHQVLCLKGLKGQWGALFTRFWRAMFGRRIVIILDSNPIPALCWPVWAHICIVVNRRGVKLSVFDDKSSRSEFWSQ